MNNKLKAFKINFASKGFFKEKINENKILGEAYYILNNDYKIVKQFIQIKNANFRPTDAEMLKTFFYKRSNIKKIRNVLEDIQKGYGYEPKDISKKQKIRLELKKNEVDYINKFLLEQFKIKSSIDIFTGSNSSGAESVATNSDIFAYENKNDLIQDGCNFTNPFNRNELYSKDKNVEIKSLDEIELISIEEYFKKAPSAKEIFKEYNYSKYYIFNDFADSIKSELNTDLILDKIEKEFNLNSSKEKKSIEYFIKQIYSKIDECFMFKKDKKTLAKNLRDYQKVLINYEKRELLKKYDSQSFQYFNNFINNDNYPNCEHAHIISVEKILNEEDPLKWFQIADNNNCLLLSPNIHEAFDRKQIYFDESGNCFKKDNENISDISIKNEVLNNERKKYLKKYIEINNFIKKD